MLRLTSFVAALVAAVTGVLVAPGPARAAAPCQIAYTIKTQWTGGFTGTVAITNRGALIQSWTLVWPFTAGQKVYEAWNVDRYTQPDAVVTTYSAPHNSELPTDATTSIGFNATWSGSNPEPATFSVNGLACDVI